MERDDWGLRLLRVAEKLSHIGGILAAVALVAMPFLVMVQVMGRWTGFTLSGAPEYASYSFGALSFLGLAYTLRDRAHIRVSFLLSGNAKMNRRVEIFCHFVGSLLGGYVLYLTVKGVYVSWIFNDISQGHDATPLWIPQLATVVGAALFLLLMVSRLISLIRNRGDEVPAEANLLDFES